MKPVSDIIAAIDYLQPISPTVLQVMEAAEKPDTGFVEISVLINHDPAVVANLLKIANSAYFGFLRQVDSAQDAVALLGLDQVIEMVFLQAMSKNMTPRCAGYALESGDLWRHSVCSAAIAKSIAQQLKQSWINRIFTSALVKDIGKVILDQHVSGFAQEIQDLVQKQKMSFVDAEKKVIGIDHAELGALVAEKWNFPAPIIHIIRNHHSSDVLVREDPETCIIQAADAICSMMGIGTGIDGMAYKIGRQVALELLSEQQVQELIYSFFSSREELFGMLDLL